MSTPQHMEIYIYISYNHKHIIWKYISQPVWKIYGLWNIISYILVVDGLSHYNPMISIFDLPRVSNWCRISSIHRISLWNIPFFNLRHRVPPGVPTKCLAFCRASCRATSSCSAWL